MTASKLKARSQLGKYRIVNRIGEGGFAAVYRARDTIEGMDVALKVPHAQHMASDALEQLRREVRLTATLEHPNILPIKNAAVIDGIFVIASPLGLETLHDRLARRVTARVALSFARQAIDAVAYAHSRRLIHCDIKPENFILFPAGRLKLADFGIAKVALQRMTLASGQGTVGYMAPEQALGKPGLRSDVFSLGLVIYRMFSGVLPVWPYDWPPPGIERARQALHPDFLAVLQRCMQIDDRKRFADAQALSAAVGRLKGRILKQRRAQRPQRVAAAKSPAWRSVRTREFVRRFGRTLEARARCAKCRAPTSESMRFCPWCRHAVKRYQGPHRFTVLCPRCGRSGKRDFRFCAYCYGPAINEPSTRAYSDRRYSARCAACRGRLMPFMRYCPSCRAKTTRRWRIEGSTDRCGSCAWGVVNEFWEHCPWCGRTLAERKP